MVQADVSDELLCLGERKLPFKDFVCLFFFFFQLLFQNVYCPRNPVQAQLGGRCKYPVSHFVWFYELDICWTVLRSPCIHKENGAIIQSLLVVSTAPQLLIALTVPSSFIWNKCHGAKTFFGIEWDSLMEKEIAGIVFCQTYSMSGNYCFGDMWVFNVKSWYFVYQKLQPRQKRIPVSFRLLRISGIFF